MSVKVMGWIWDQPLPRDEKLVALAYADHADHDGGEIYPSIALIAAKTGYSSRSVQRITRKLEQRGLLVPDGESDWGTKRWRMPVDMGGDILSPLTDDAEGGDKLARGGDKSSRNQRGGGDTAMSPKPSLNRKQNRPFNRKRRTSDAPPKHDPKDPFWT